MVLVVDESNNPVGKATRLEAKEKNLYQRCCYVYIYNTNIKAFVV